MSNDKPTPKRHIGPAMQWAKPQTDRAASAGRGDREIKIEFPDVAPDPAPTAYDLGEGDTPSGTGAPVPSSSKGELSSRSRRNPAEPAEHDTTDPWWRRATAHSEREDSASTEYSAARQRGAGERFMGTQRGGDEALTTYNYGSDDYESSFADTYKRGTVQHNASSFDGAQHASSHDDRTVWWQYLLPIAVVGLVIFLALLTLIT